MNTQARVIIYLGSIVLMLSLFLLPVLSSVAIAETSNAATAPEPAYQQLIHVPTPEIAVPTVVQLPLSSEVVTNGQFLVYEKESSKYLGSYLYQVRQMPLPLLVMTSVANGQYLVDGKFSTYAEYQVAEDGENLAVITLRASEPVTTSELRLTLDRYVALPLTIEVLARLNESDTFTTVVAERRLSEQIVRFPEVTAREFQITFTYAQPLRIAEIDLVRKEFRETERFLRFLAQPGYTYDVYFDADRAVAIPQAEVGDLRDNTGVLTLPSYSVLENPIYAPADIDGDGVPDLFDNCVRVENPGQEDVDGNLRGDACDDFDRDGVINSIDNCFNQPNKWQEDEDGDGIGDVCDDEESRLTEKHQWIPWVGIGGAALVILLLFVLVAKGPRPQIEVGNTDRS